MMKLAKREKYLVSFAACSIGLFLLLQLLIFPFFEEKKGFREVSGQRRRALRKL